MKKKYLPALAAALALPCLSNCTTGKVYTSTRGGATSFSYAIPETIVKIDLPVKCWRVGKTENGVFKPGASALYAYLEGNATDTAVVSFEFDGHRTPLNVRILDQLNNTTSLDKFDVTYFTSGTQDDPRSSGLLKGINSEGTDKVADTVKAVTETVGQVLKIAANVGIQTGADEGAPVVFLEDHIRVSVRLSELRSKMNTLLAQEVERIKSKAADMPQAIGAKGVRGIKSLDFSGKVAAWPSEITQSFIAHRMVGGPPAAEEKVFVNKDSTNLVNGIIYVDPQNAPFTLAVEIETTGGKKVSAAYQYVGQLPEAGRFRVLPLNPKFLGARKIAAAFSRNGKLVSWSYGSPSRAAAAATFAKDETTLLNTIATEAAAQRAKDTAAAVKEATDAANRRVNLGKYEAQVIAQEGVVSLAKATERQKLNVLNAAKEALEKNQDAEKKTALAAAVDAADIQWVTAHNAVSDAQANLDTLNSKRTAIQSGLLAP